jgi:kynureninase
VNEVLDVEWGRAWCAAGTTQGWMAAPTRLGDRLAPLIGARLTRWWSRTRLTIALAKLIGGALEQRADRHVVLTDVANFHSDIYIVARDGRPRRTTHHDEDDRTRRLDEELNDDVALVMLTHVDFRTGEMLDMAGITEQGARRGAR